MAQVEIFGEDKPHFTIARGSGDCPVTPRGAEERLMRSKQNYAAYYTLSRHPNAGMATERAIQKQ
jgi:hypothetical protein